MSLEIRRRVAAIMSTDAGRQNAVGLIRNKESGEHRSSPPFYSCTCLVLAPKMASPEWEINVSLSLLPNQILDTGFRAQVGTISPQQLWAWERRCYTRTEPHATLSIFISSFS